LSVVARVRRAGRLSVAVDVSASLNLVATMVKYLGLSVLFPTAIALIYSEPVWPFLLAGAITIGFGAGLERVTSGAARVGVREGFLVISLTWLLAAGVGALPYVLSGDEQLGHPIDAYFEAMSGFTTTGASIATDLPDLSRSLAMWRQFTQWLGGMGIIVLALAILPRLRVGGRQLLEAELPGPEFEQLAARIRDIARRLWILYVALTAIEALALAVVGWTGIDKQMDLFNAVAHALTTMPTGGFSPEARSIEAFGAVSQWVIVLFMIVAGMNFALTYRALVRRDPRAIPRDEEFRLYLGLLALGAAILAVEVWTEGIAAGEAGVRTAVFQAVSIMTTTGYASADFAGWTTLAAMTLVGLMFAGGSAGSTSGSIKVVRHLLLGRILRRELHQTLHPELVVPVRMNRRVVDERTLRAIEVFILLYVGIFVVGTGLLAFDAARTGLELSAIGAVAASATTLGNVGPALGFAGPMGSFAPFSDFSKLVMVALMWLGRLEVIPIVVLFTRAYWRV
jgi:trk system potassium uptake protein TrkH